MQRVTRRNQMGSFIKAPTRVRGAEVITRYTSSRCLLRNKHPASVVMRVLRLKFASAELGAGSNCMGRSCSFAIAPPSARQQVFPPRPICFEVMAMMMLIGIPCGRGQQVVVIFRNVDKK